MRWSGLASFLTGLLALSACGEVDSGREPPRDKDAGDAGEEPPALGPISGTRLRAEYWDFDGLRVLFHFFDTERGEECDFDFLGGSDGRYYCLPTASTHAYRGDVCVQGFDSFGNPLTRSYIVDETDDACGEHSSVFEMECSDVVNGYCVLERGAPIELGEFAVAREEVAPGTGRIRPFSLVTDDGARVPFGAWDEELATRVKPSADEWHPMAFAYGDDLRLFADSECTRPAASKFASSAVCPIKFVATGPSQYSEVGAQLEKAYSRGEDGSCVEVPWEYVYFFEIGPPANLDLARAEQVEQGNRLRLPYWVGSGGEPLVMLGAKWFGAVMGEGLTLLSFHDTERDEPCHLVVMGDGTAYCLPEHLESSAFADAACTERVMWISSQRPVPKTMTRVTYVGCGSDGPYEYEVWSVGAPVGSSVYRLEGTACVPVSSENGEYYRFSKQIPFDAYASAPLVRE